MTARADVDRLLFYATPPHECSYLPGREATTLFADPRFPKNAWLYTVLSQNGFRRSGQHIYRPRCAACSACVPVRIPVADFRPRRRQQRIWRRNHDLRVLRRDPEFRAEHFQLYRHYINTRHAGGGMENPTPRQYMEFLTSPWADTQFFEFRHGRELLAVAVVDVLVNGYSAVYTFFDPGRARRSLGAYAILWEIAEARRLGLDWLYLGYWIDQSPKMRYKRDYQPQEHYRDQRWVRDAGA